jgi:hypothetical protein
MIILKPLLGLFFKEVVEDSAKKLAKRSIDNLTQDEIRKQFLRIVAEGYTREVQHNLSQYVQAVGAASVSIEIDEETDSETLFGALQSSLRTLEVELERLGPDSPVSQYLERRYGGGREIFVGREQVSVARMIAGGDTRQEPWLNRDSNFEKLISLEASRILDQLLDEALP